MSKKRIIIVIGILIVGVICVSFFNRKKKIMENHENPNEMKLDLSYEFDEVEQEYKIVDKDGNVLKRVDDKSSIQFFLDNPEYLDKR